jgi:hypothetical protein
MGAAAVMPSHVSTMRLLFETNIKSFWALKYPTRWSWFFPLSNCLWARYGNKCSSDEMRQPIFLWACAWQCSPCTLFLSLHLSWKDDRILFEKTLYNGLPTCYWNRDLVQLVKYFVSRIAENNESSSAVISSAVAAWHLACVRSRNAVLAYIYRYIL